MSEARRLLSASSSRYQSKTETIHEDPLEGLISSHSEQQQAATTTTTTSKLRHRIGNIDQVGASGNLWSPLTPKTSPKQFFAMDTQLGPTSPIFKPTTTTVMPGSAGGTQYGTLESSLNLTGGGGGGTPLLLASTPKRSILVDIHPTTHFTRKQLLIGSLALLLFLGAITVTLTLGLPRMEAARQEYFAANFVSSNVHEQVFAQQTVLVDSAPECAGIGKAMLQLQNGTAVDAALAALLCAQVTSPHLTGGGLVGGFQMLYYSGGDGRAYSVDARSRSIQLPLNNKTAVRLHSPALVKAAQEVNQRWGKFQWSKVLEPAVELALGSVHVTEQLARSVRQHQQAIEANEHLRQLFVVSNKSEPSAIEIASQVKGEQSLLIDQDDRFRNVRLGKTLKSLYDNAALNLQNGSLANDYLKDIVAAIAQAGHNVSDDSLEVALREQLSTLQPRVRLATSEPLFNGTLITYSMAGDGGNDNSSFNTGPLVVTFLTLLEQVMSKKDSDFYYCNDKNRSLKEGATEFHTVIEALKTVAKLSQHHQGLSDEAIDQIAELWVGNKEVSIEDFIDANKTSQLEPVDDRWLTTTSVLVYDGKKGDVVVITADAPSLFAPNSIYSNSTGLFLPLSIVEQESVDSFAQPWPRSPVSPILLVDPETRQVRFATSVSGPGADDQTSSLMSLDAQLQVLYKIFLNCQTLKSSTDESRFYYDNDGDDQDSPISYESSMPAAYLDLLGRLFDHYDLQPLDVSEGRLPGVYSIYRMDNNQQVYNRTMFLSNALNNFQLSSIVDFRQGGFIDGN